MSDKYERGGITPEIREHIRRIREGDCLGGPCHGSRLRAASPLVPTLGIGSDNAFVFGHYTYQRNGQDWQWLWNGPDTLPGAGWIEQTVGVIMPKNASDVQNDAHALLNDLKSANGSAPASVDTVQRAVDLIIDLCEIMKRTATHVETR